ncbi:ATPase, F1 complex, gamma subunit [sediment metagenome]|uniref:ATPase, F1 complex, gamma subunit n=1 Tax=sediment metagenome TaxID=749907 RepID=D9PHX3_9ZZZZ
MFAKFSDLPDAITTSDITPISSLLIDRFLSGEFHSVTVFYMDFVNTLTQKPLTLPLLPLAAMDDNDEATLATASQSEYLFEPNPKMILDRLLPYYVENTIYQSFLEARASEHSARMVTMKNASQNANELVADLKLVFNKQRQASITNELLDITTAMASLS